eukprot:1192113-Prorocentrum_minimum.AAC.3
MAPVRYLHSRACRNPHRTSQPVNPTKHAAQRARVAPQRRAPLRGILSRNGERSDTIVDGDKHEEDCACENFSAFCSFSPPFTAPPAPLLPSPPPDASSARLMVSWESRNRRRPWPCRG